MRKIILFTLLLPLIGFSQRDYSKMEVAHTELAPGLHRLLVGNSVSVMAYDGHDGLLLIDAAYEQTAPQLRDTLNSLFGKPVRYLINTHLHGDHTGGNPEFGKEAEIISHHSVKTWLESDRKQGDRVPGPMPKDAIPDITFEGTLNLDFNGQTIEMRHLAGGHTAGDVILFFPKSNVLALGDLLFAGYFPYIDMGQGGNPYTFIKHLKWVLETYPEDVTLVGGHGPVYTMNQLRSYVNNLELTIVKIAEAKENGLSIEQIKQDRILKDWESYGSFFITEDRWIETIYPLAGE